MQQRVSILRASISRQRDISSLPSPCSSGRFSLHNAHSSYLRNECNANQRVERNMYACIYNVRIGCRRKTNDYSRETTFRCTAVFVDPVSSFERNNECMYAYVYTFQATINEAPCYETDPNNGRSTLFSALELIYDQTENENAELS